MAIAPAEPQVAQLALEGTLQDTPFAVLLQSLFATGRTVAVELQARHLHKRLFLEDGVPVDCESNLLHETPGRFLVEKGKLDETQYQQALNAAVLADERIEQTLLREQRIVPFELFKLLQQNLALKILDCFCATWSDARYRVIADPPEVKQPLRLNLPQLIFTGASTFSPFSEIERRVEHLAMGQVGLADNAPHPLSALKLASKDARLISELKGRPSIELLLARLDSPLEDLLRKLYALDVLGYLVVFAAAPRTPQSTLIPEALPQPVAAAAAPTPALPVPAVEVVPEAARDAVISAYLTHRSHDAFELFALAEAATAAEVRAAFLAWSERFAPWRFEQSDLHEKARDLFLAGARAYAQLTDAEQRALVLKRRTAAREVATRKRTTDFSIKTDLLDAPSRFLEGERKVAAGDHRAAIELFEFASACDPRKALYRVRLAQARFMADGRAERQALTELDEAFRIDPQSGEAQLVMAQIHQARGRLDAAEAALHKATRLLPGDRRAVEGLRAVASARKAQSA
jgi:tetratricopeptide (TPR) repeat protein